MEHAELERVSASLAGARSAEEVFGQLKGTQEEKLAEARTIFRRLARIVHPDHYEGTDDFARADLVFKQLAQFWEQARERLENGTYGMASADQAFKPFKIQTASGLYTLERLLAQGDLCNLYAGRVERDYSSPVRRSEYVLLKVPKRPEDNDLLVNEARILKHLRGNPGYAQASNFVSRLVEAFPYEERATGIVRQIVALYYMADLYSLKEVRAAYAGGIDARDMAWIWRRLLVALDFAHSSSVIHGAVLPVHVLIQPEQHGVVLIDWSYAVIDPERTHERISAISSDYRAWYPAEVFAKEEPAPALDIYMAASCMIDLLGGNPREQTMPARVPWQIQNHLKGCMLARSRQRPQDAGVLLKEFDELLERLWGPRTFHAFSMPPRS